MNKLIFNLLPEDSSHLITIKFSNWIFNLNFVKGKSAGAKEAIERKQMFGNHQ
jgi:hypothetical protein